MATFKWVVVGLLVLAILGFGAYLAFFQGNPPIQKTVNIALSVKPAPDFMVTTNTDVLVSFINRTIGFVVNLTPVNDFAGDVYIEVSGIPGGWSIGYLPAQVVTLGGTETKSISVDITIPDDPAAVGDYTIIVTATSTNYN